MPLVVRPAARFPEFYGRGGRLHADGAHFDIKGFNWWGSEGEWQLPYGLTNRSAREILRFARKHDFNAMRLLFSWEAWEADGPVPASHFSAALNPWLVGATYRGMIAHLVEAAAEQSVLVLLGCHRLQRAYSGADPKSSHAEWPGTWDGLWHSERFPEARIASLWASVAAAHCARSWNVFGVDLMNEPWAASWGDGDARTDWRAGSERLGNAVLAACPRWMVLVQGTADPGMWGENLSGVRDAPVRLSNGSKLAYSPHTYGPSLFARTPQWFPQQFKADDFPSNLAGGWEWLWGHVTSTGAPLLLGEIGGDATCCEGRDAQYATPQDAAPRLHTRQLPAPSHRLDGNCRRHTCLTPHLPCPVAGGTRRWSRT